MLYVKSNMYNLITFAKRKKILILNVRVYRCFFVILIKYITV